ncbi:hypothetical protein CLOP_g24515, partial [Closterium sp. NIES-67]
LPSFTHWSLSASSQCHGCLSKVHCLHRLTLHVSSSVRSGLLSLPPPPSLPTHPSSFLLSVRLPTPPSFPPLTHAPHAFALQVVVAFDPLAWPRSEVIRFPVSSPNLLVTDASGTPIPSQVLRDTLLSPTTRATYIAAYTGTGGGGGEEGAGVGEDVGEKGDERQELEDGQWQPSQQRKSKRRKLLYSQ